MRAYEHRTIGDAATGTAMVNVGGESADEQFWLTFGDVVALSGDFFRPGDAPETNGRAGDLPGAAAPTGHLFALARIPGVDGTAVGTRDELLCALKVTSVDEGFVDRRFEPGGQFAGLRFSPGAQRTDVERRVRDRYLTLAASNDDHFVAPGRSDAVTGSGCGSGGAAYRALHHVALDEAWQVGRRGGDLTRAMAREAAAQHYLTDAFSAGHLRTPVAEIRRHWAARYPAFWSRLQAKVASETARALRELSRAMRLVPPAVLERRTASELRSRTSRYPELSVGDLVARCFHDWDSTHGLAVSGGRSLFGDGHLDEGGTKELALAAVRAGNDDIEVAFDLGRSGRDRPGPLLYEAVRERTGAGDDAFLAEARIPTVDDTNPPQNWMADDVETLWGLPMVGTRGPTVGEALVAMLEPDGQFIRQLDGLGQGLAGAHGVFAVPVLGPWLGDKCCQAYHGGFVEPLARDPLPVILDLVHGPGDAHAPTAVPRRLAAATTGW